MNCPECHGMGKHKKWCTVLKRGIRDILLLTGVYR